MPDQRVVNGTKTASHFAEVVMSTSGTGRNLVKWGIIGSAIAGGAALIPLIPVIKRRAMRVTTILKKDHRMVGGLVATLQMAPKVNGRVRKTLFDQIRNSLMIHTHVEEEILFPVMRHYMFPGGASKVEDAYRDHQEITDLLNDLSWQDTLSDTFDTKFADLKSKIDRHVQEVENEMFRIITERMSTDEQEDLGRRIHERKMELKTRMAA
jgi:hemerythrin-like domain-containing protein